MWGADTPLVFDALQMVAVAAIIGGGTVFAVMRVRRKSKPDTDLRPRNDLEERVQVLERIATDRSHDLADQIEQLRDTNKTEGTI